IRLVQTGRPGVAALNAFGTVAATLLAAAAGFLVSAL
ncbi:MAG: chromosome condensation protein CrcB, partial [Sinomonas sp.]|nr:chromosome condensation protein CrcB [Sinomonas sp.]